MRNLALKHSYNAVSLNGREPWSFVMRLAKIRSELVQRFALLLGISFQYLALPFFAATHNSFDPFRIFQKVLKDDWTPFF